MSHSHLLSSPLSRRTSDEDCLSAFQQELDYIYWTLRRMGVSRSEVEDLAQEVFIALRGAWVAYDQTRPIRPYLFGIAFRIASAHQRKRRREISFGTVDPDDAGPWPDAALQSKQSRAIVLAALKRIPLPRRAALVMHEIDDVPVAEIAALLAIPRFTVYSRLRKARRELEAAVRRVVRQGDVE